MTNEKDPKNTLTAIDKEMTDEELENLAAAGTANQSINLGDQGTGQSGDDYYLGGLTPSVDQGEGEGEGEEGGGGEDNLF